MPATAGCPCSEPRVPSCAEQPRLHEDELICLKKTSLVVSWSELCSYLAVGSSGSCLLSAFSDCRKGTGQGLMAVVNISGGQSQQVPQPWC